MAVIRHVTSSRGRDLSEYTGPELSLQTDDALSTKYLIFNRCYSDSMAELPEHDEATNGEKIRAISLDLVKRRLDKALYKRLDHFQQDMFSVFERFVNLFLPNFCIKCKSFIWP